MHVSNALDRIFDFLEPVNLAWSILAALEPSESRLHFGNIQLMVSNFLGVCASHLPFEFLVQLIVFLSLGNWVKL